MVVFFFHHAQLAYDTFFNWIETTFIFDLAFG